MFVLRWIGFVFALAIAAAASQLPEFAQQYRQRLGGAIDELTRVLTDFDKDAAGLGMQRPQAIARLRDDADAFLKSRGVRIETYVDRLARLQRQRSDFQNAGSFARMAVMARDFDSEIAQRAWDDFEPATPLTSEGAVSAGAGFLAGFALWKLIGWPFSRRRRRVAVSRDAGRIEPKLRV